MGGLQFGLFHSLRVLSNRQGIYHGLNISGNKTLKVVRGVANAVVGYAALGIIIGSDFCRTVARRHQALAAISNIVDILLVFAVVYKGT